MSERVHNTKTDGPPLWFKIARVGGVFVAVVVVLVVAWIIRDWRARAAVDAELDHIRRRGEPVTVAQALPSPVPEKDNGAPLLLEAARCHTEVEKTLSRDVLIARFNKTSDTYWDYLEFDEVRLHKDIVERAVDAHADTVRLIRRALERDSLVFTFGSSAEFMEPAFVPRIKELALLLRAAARIHALAGRGTQAVDVALTAVRLADKLRDNHLLPAQAARSFVVGCAIQALSDAATVTLLSHDDMKRLVDALARATAWDCMADVLRAERAVGIEWTEAAIYDPSRLSLSGQTGRWEGLHSLAYRYRLRQSRLHYLNAMADLAAAAEVDSWEAIPGAEEIEMHYQTSASVSTAFVRRLLTPATTFFKAIAEMDAAIMATRLGLACELYSEKHGVYPPSLRALVPEFVSAIPKDPFTGAQLVYECAGGHYIVYSVGRNLADDGGGRSGSVDDVGWSSLTSHNSTTGPADAQ